MTPRFRGVWVAACVIALAVSSSTPPAEGQGRQSVRSDSDRAVEPRNRDDGSRGFLMVGFHGLDLEDLNARLDVHGYPSFDDGMLTLGGGGWAVNGRFMIGGEGHGLIGKSRTTSDGVSKTRLSGGYGTFDVGYRIPAGNRLDLYPLLGIGAGGVVLDITERSTPTFDQVLDDPRRGVRLRAGMLVVSLALGIDVGFSGRRMRHGEGAPAIGAKIGYLFSTKPDKWRRDRNDVSGVPDVSLSGPFAQLMVGGWGRR